MEASSSSFSSRRWQVFVSFRGEDTRSNFISHLVAALQRKSINAYIDDITLRKGDAISQVLKEAIESSRIALVILSENYASSSWCLNELSWIVECRQKMNQIVVPIFCHVDPSDVRKQTGSFADAFTEHSRKKSADELKKWRSALEEIGQLSGHHLTVHERSEHEFIEKIVKDISSKLSFGSSNNFQGLVGIQSRVEQIISLINSESKEVVKVGIWGMGGIGKTTTARAVFNLISALFESCHFIPNVREKFGNHDGHISLQNKLVSLILGEECQEISPVIQDRLQCKKVLVVLDDVNDPIQLDFLRPSRCFGDGSRIIITSRDKQVLQQVVDEIYQVQGLIEGEDLELFSSFAFNARYPENDFVALSHKVVECAGGVPLALKVMGSALKGKSSREWKGFLDKLKDTPNPTIKKILKISYDDLDYNQKDLFLDIACFFRGKDRASILEIYGDMADYDIGVLIDKSLIVVEVSEPIWENIQMHDLLQEMGWDIARQESVSEPGKHSRVWKHEDVRHVLKNSTGTEVVQGMVLDMSEMRELHISPTTFERMKNLRLLKFHLYTYDPILFRRQSQKLRVKGDELCSISDRLNYLHWDGCPLKSLPLQFCAENLVQLIMPLSKLEKLWDGEQNLVNLKPIILRGCRNLLEIPNLSQARNLESMDLRYCVSLCDLPNCTGLTSLETLNLEGCSQITKFPEISESIRDLNLSETGIKELPASIGGFARMEVLNLRDCQHLQIIPRSIFQLESLMNKKICLSSFSNLVRSVELLRSVECLTIDLKKYKLSTKQTEFVVKLDHRNSAEMEWFGKCMSSLTSLKELNLLFKPPGELLHKLQNLLSLELISLKHCNLVEFPRCLTYMFSLKDLNLSGNCFQKIPESIKQLSALEKLDLSKSWRLQSLPELPMGLKYLRAYDCQSLESVSTPLTMSVCATRISFIGCLKLDTSPLENEAQRIILHRAQGDVKLCKQGCINNPPLIISYPGSQIPKWFSYQNKGSEITIKLPPQCLDDKFLGITFVAILDLDFKHLDIGVNCKFKSQRGLSQHFDVPLYSASDDTVLRLSDGDDHVLIGYSCRLHCELLKFGPVKEASFFFSSTTKHTYSDTRTENKIKKCGVCLLYTKDAEERSV